MRLLRYFTGPILGIACCLSACGDDGGSADNPDAGDVDAGIPEALVHFTSGTRLKADYLDGGGAAKRLLQWLDTTSGEVCKFAVDESWEYRCLPTMAIQPEYIDASCTMPVTQADAVDERKYAIADLRERCIGLPRHGTYEVLATSVDLSDAYHINLQGECVTSNLPSVTTYRNIAQIAPTTFAKAIPTFVSVDSGLGVQVLTTEGGASQTSAKIESASGAKCYSMPVADTSYCVPGDFVYDYGQYVAADCTTGIGYSIGSDQCEAAQYAMAFEPTGSMDACDPSFTPTLHNLGTRLGEGETYLAQGDQSCVVAPEGTYWNVGSLVPWEFLSTTTQVKVGDGDVRFPYEATEMGTPLHQSQSGYTDAAGAACTLAMVSDDAARCIPGVFLTSSYWDSATCDGQRLVRSREACGEIWAPHAQAFTLVDSDPFSSFDKVYSLGAEHSASTYQLSDTTCTLVEANPSFHYQILGAEITTAAFPEVARVRDP